MRFLIPAVALLGLVCLACIPVPVIWGLLIAVCSLLLILSVIAGRVFDAMLNVVLRHQAKRRRAKDVHRGTGIAKKTRRSPQAQPSA